MYFDALNKDGIDVLFINGTAIAKKYHQNLSNASMHNNIYQVLGHDPQAEYNLQRSLVAHQSESTVNITVLFDEMSRFPTNDAGIWHFI